ncbi:MAG: tripartite tricarboxylate transporter substrate binding protein, partial [Alphaproteobacteria bacterium]|nr:tripartite tricarboxylate transporter substrate binding protein [Alphaproteobacteria bacterium]
MLDRRRFLTIAAASSAGLANAAARAQQFPTKPLQMIVAFAPGGGTDVAARSIARTIEKHLGAGASIGVVNRPGAGGEIGWTALAQSAPDGYTIGFINAPAIAAMTVEKQTRFTMDSFDPIGNLVYDACILAVHRDSAFKTLADMIDFAKKNPGALTVGSTGASGNSEHLALLQLQRLQDIKVNHAPFGGTAPMRQALLGRHIPVGAFNLSEGIEQAREGNLRILGVMADQRQKIAPEVPTFREQGIDVIAGSSRGIAAPKGVPEPILARLREAVRAAMNDPEYVAAAEKALIPLRYMDGAE